MPVEILSERYDEYVHAHSAATTAKVALALNGVPVIPLNDADADADNVFVYRAPKVRVNKATGEAWTPGEPVYFHSTNLNFTNISTGAVMAGYVVEAALSADSEGVIDLDPSA